MRTTYHTTNYSDDCASFYRNGEHVEAPDEYDSWGKWWPLRINGVHVADVMTTFGDGWEFHIRGLHNVVLEIDFIPNPEHEEGCFCDRCDPPPRCG